MTTKWKRRVIPATVAIFAICAIFLTPYPEPSSGQRSTIPKNRRPACTCFCGDGTFASFALFDMADIKAGKCFGGPLSAKACRTKLEGLPDSDVQALCKKVQAQGGKVCPVLAPFCEPDAKQPPPEKKCEKPTPWFDGPPKCLVVSPQIAVIQGAVVLSMCGSSVFRYVLADKDPNLIEAYISVLKELVQQRIGSEICCNQFRAASRSGIPCNPVVDLDCDGIPNDTDVFSESGASFPDINNLFSSPEGAPSDPFPFGLDPDDPEFLPPPEKCDCKWELVKGTINCSPDGTQRHYYEASWRCPSTGNKKNTRKYATPTTPCP